MYYVYMLRCEDDSIYTGIAKNLEKRMEEHFSKDTKCAKYTKSHKAKKLEIAWQTQNKSLASKLEYAIKKKLTKVQKEEIIKNNMLLNKYLGEIVEINNYMIVKNKETL